MNEHGLQLFKQTSIGGQTVYVADNNIRSSTNYLNDTNRFDVSSRKALRRKLVDVSSKGPSSEISWRFEQRPFVGN